MRAVIATLVLAALTGAPVAAQEGQGGGGGGRRMMGLSIEELTTRLKLDDSQQAKIKPMLEKFAADSKSARETMMANFQAVRSGQKTREEVQPESMAAMMVIREHMDSLNKDIRTVLTPDQQKEFDTWLAERAERMRQMRPPPGV